MSVTMACEKGNISLILDEKIVIRSVFARTFVSSFPSSRRMRRSVSNDVIRSPWPLVAVWGAVMANVFLMLKLTDFKMFSMSCSYITIKRLQLDKNFRGIYLIFLIILIINILDISS